MEKAEVRNIITEIQSGDEKNMYKLLKNYDWLINAIQMKFKRVESFTYADFKQVGYIALMRAARKFDLNKGVAFTSYCWPVVQREFNRALMDSDKLIRVPSHVYFTLRKIKKDKNFKVGKKLARNLKSNFNPYRDKVVFGQVPETLYEERYEKILIDMVIDRILIRLRKNSNKKHYNIFIRKIFLGQSLEEIGKIYKNSKQAINHVIRKYFEEAGSIVKKMGLRREEI